MTFSTTKQARHARLIRWLNKRQKKTVRPNYRSVTVKTKRKVIIRDMGSFWAVAYVSRRKFTHHWRAQFHKSVKTREQVTEWINQQTNIEL